jgi:hypothetical protein
MAAQAVHLASIQLRLVLLAALAAQAVMLAYLLSLEVLEARVAVLVALVVKVEMHTLLQHSPVAAAALAVTLVLVVLVVVVFVMELLVLAVAQVAVLVDEQFPELVRTPALAAAVLAYWVRAQAVVEVLFILAGVAVQVVLMDKTHHAPHMLADHTAELMVVAVAVLVVLLTTGVVMVLLVRFALFGPVVHAHSHQLVRETYK